MTKQDLLLSRRAFMAGGGAAVFGVAAGFPGTAQAETAVHQLGDTTLQIEITGNGNGLTYFAPHANESISIAAARAVVREKGGRIIRLVQEGQSERNKSFRIGNERFVFDPNRIFTDTGIGKTLKAQGKTYTPAAHLYVRSLAYHIVLLLRRGRSPVVALHNNSDGRYSILSYQEGGSDAKEAAEVYRNPEMDSDDFFFVTKKNHFDALASKKMNVGLQSRRPTDDGSLSVFCARNGIAYVNVEAQKSRSHQRIQENMIRTLLTVV